MFSFFHGLARILSGKQKAPVVSRFGPEIDKIIFDFADNQALRNLSLTCKQYNNILFPRIYVCGRLHRDNARSLREHLSRPATPDAFERSLRVFLSFSTLKVHDIAGLLALKDVSEHHQVSSSAKHLIFTENFISHLDQRYYHSDNALTAMVFRVLQQFRPDHICLERHSRYFTQFLAKNTTWNISTLTIHNVVVDYEILPDIPSTRLFLELPEEGTLDCGQLIGLYGPSRDDLVMAFPTIEILNALAGLRVSHPVSDGERFIGYEAHEADWTRSTVDKWTPESGGCDYFVVAACEEGKCVCCGGR